jgi:polyhydroxyalkanoate synthesis regulator phasin
MKATTGLMMVVAAGAILAYFGPATATAALPPDPDNAALLYYQAFLLMAQSDDRAMGDLVASVANGAAAPDEKVRDYVNKCRTAIDYAVTASSLEKCDWGLAYSRGFSAVLPHLGQGRSLARVILADAQILNVDGNYRQALERCLTVYKLAGHFGDSVLVSVLVSAAITAQANKGVTAILDRMPADVGTLTWLKGQFAVAPIATLTINKSMTMEREVALEYLRPERAEDLVQALVESGGISEAIGMSAEEIRRAATEPALTRAREYYSKYMDAVFVVLNGQMSYVEARARLQELVKRAEQDAAQDPGVRLFRAGVPAILKMYDTQVRHKADFNALQAAIDVYLAKAGTGHLPPSLPPAAPRDPYSGGAFQYEPTGSGFVLRCGTKDLDKNEVREYRFTTAK